MYSNNEQYCILYLKQWYNYVYLFNRYLLQSENTSKLYSSLHTKQKNSSLDFFTSNYVQSSFNNSPISSNLFKFHPNNLEFPKRDIGTHKNLRSFFFSFISCYSGAYAGEAHSGGGGAVGVVEVTRFFYRIIQSLSCTYYQPATRLQTYTKAASSSSDLYRTACETTATPTATPATHYPQTEK